MDMRFASILVTLLIVFLGQSVVFSGEIDRKDIILHFDQPQAPLKSLDFKHNRELKPDSNNFRIIEVSYLSNNFGERWAIVTLENSSSGGRFLKNKTIVATFANGDQAYAHNLNEVFRRKERLTKAVFFGVHMFPIVSVQVE